VRWLLLNQCVDPYSKEDTSPPPTRHPALHLPPPPPAPPHACPPPPTQSSPVLHLSSPPAPQPLISCLKFKIHSSNNSYRIKSTFQK
jgi:hypothetical protein